MKYKIKSVEEVTSPKSGKVYKQVWLEDGTKVSCWPDFSQYEQVIEDAEVEGVIITKGQYKNLVDKKPNTMYQKSDQIKQNMEHKDNSIKWSGACRDATQIVVAYPDLLSNPELKEKLREEWQDWRKWFLSKYTEPFA